MTLSLTGLFVLYVVVFLAVIFAAWLIAAWKSQQNARRMRQFVTCGYCGAGIPVEGKRYYVRCPGCGGRQSLQMPVATAPGRHAS